LPPRRGAGTAPQGLQIRLVGHSVERLVVLDEEPFQISPETVAGYSEKASRGESDHQREDNRADDDYQNP
jgi:hypothetical protein